MEQARKQAEKQARKNLNAQFIKIVIHISSKQNSG